MTTTQIGGSDAATELAAIQASVHLAPAILRPEREARIAKALRVMAAQQIDALMLPAGTSLYYFTGLQWYASERLVGAVLTKRGVTYIAPAFEESKIGQLLDNPGAVSGSLRVWQEEEEPSELVGSILREQSVASGKIALDEQAQFFVFDGLRQALPLANFINGKTVTAACRMHKSAQELALLQTAKNITLDVHRRAARMLRPGIAASEVEQFIDNAHRAHGAAKSTFCIVGFGAATAIPHGVEGEQYLREGDMVLIDTGCRVQGYHSDITRSYVFGEATPRQAQVWQAEKEAQAAAFAAAQIGVACGDVDLAARKVLQAAGFGPGYKLPGLPHRTGHGVGLDIHEWPYLVKDNPLALAAGMCFSNEPMIVIEGEMGIRLEDHFYMTEDGPRWFTEPSPSLAQPFCATSRNPCVPESRAEH